jgi:hypothetical protein
MPRITGGVLLYEQCALCRKKMVHTVNVWCKYCHRPEYGTHVKVVCDACWEPDPWERP